MSWINDVMRNRWLVVIAAGAIMGAALGVRHVQGLFLQPVVLTQGWSREAFGFALAVQNLVWGLAQPLTGMVADRFGSARVLFLGLLTYALGLLLMATAADPVSFTLTNGVLIGVALSGTAFGTVYGALSRMFTDYQRTWALAVAGALGGLGQFCMVPFTQDLIASLSWQGAAVVLCIVMMALAPMAICLQDRDRPQEQAPSLEASTPMATAIRQAFGHRGFWLLNLGFMACGFQLAFIATHLPVYLIERGLTAQQAGATLAIIALANIFGSYACARLGGRWPARLVLAVLYAVRVLAMAAFLALPLTAWSAYLFSAVMGFLWLGTVPLTNGVVSQIFGVRYITTLFGFVFLGHQIGGFLGVWLGGWVYDSYRSYDLLWLGSIGIGVLAACLHWPIDDRPLALRASVKAAA
ncbi:MULTISPECIES: MFS transporter [Pseudomonadota]|jgi:MFS family permease|uniref:MFS transporter n=1 Tax=Pseudomonadota TaxID=1224 RepID=UPI001F0F5BBD|nr:MFS transporter [Achromobacter xylosoxidans]MCH4578147.1 MFS transporter [Achromobacter xylosoxidans]